MVGKTVDGGENWRWKRVPNFEKTDFRDIAAFDENIALIMAVGEPGYILKTTDGGIRWKTVYTNKKPGIFLDAMQFWDDKVGIVVGDPINGKFLISKTYDGGNTWQDMLDDHRHAAIEGEALFAASGSNIQTMGEECFFVTGGTTARLVGENHISYLPIQHGSAGAGAFSVAVKNSKILIIVGGDYTKPDETEKNCILSRDGGKTWSFPETKPSGYRSCVEYINKKTWITCGPNGVDISRNEGVNWRRISTDGFNACRTSKKGKVVYLAGNNGTVAKVSML